MTVRRTARPRPRKGGTKTLSVKLPADVALRLERMAAARGTSTSAVVREAIEAYDPKPGSLADRMRELIGSVGGLPRDLSSNPKYLRDFGK